MPLIWLPSVYRLTARDYEAKLAGKMVPLINNPFDMSSVTVVLQQDGAPEKKERKFRLFRTSVDREWMAMSRDNVIKSYKAFRRRLKGIIASDGGYIE